MRGRRRLLIVAGSGTAREIASRLDGTGVEVTTATEPDAVDDHLGDVGGVVVARDLGERSGLDVVRRVREQRADLPVVLYAPDGNESVAAGAVRAGAADYVSSDDDLVTRVRRTVPTTDLRDPERDGTPESDVAADRRRQERTLRTLHEATRDLMGARDSEDIYRIAVHTARDVLSMPFATGFRYDADDDALRPVENTEAARETFGDPPTFDGGEGIVGDAFATGRFETFADATGDDRADPEGASARISSYIVAPLGEYGVFTVADATVGAFDDRDVELVKTLAANTEAALERAGRERELQRQNDRLDRFASVVGHDLRNPLAVARGHLDYLRADTRPEAEPHLDEVETSLERMDELLERLLSLARGGEAVENPRPLSVGDVAGDAWATVDGADADLTVVDDPVVSGDRSRVRQLLENLFRNCVEHGSTEGGGASDGVSVEVGALADGGFYVADDGPGVPPEKREAVLESGVSKDGTGLGLAIVRRVAEAHGWTLSLGESEAGGACVEVRTA